LVQLSTRKNIVLKISNLESWQVLEFPNTLESKLNIETTSPSCDVRKPSDGELGRKWLYLKRKIHAVYHILYPGTTEIIMLQKKPSQLKPFMNCDKNTPYSICFKLDIIYGIISSILTGASLVQVRISRN